MAFPHQSAKSEIDRRIADLRASLHRGQPNWIEVARQIQWLLGQGGTITQADLAWRLNKHPAWISRVLRILDLPADLQVKIASMQVSISLVALGKIVEIENRRWQAELVDALLAGKSEDFIKKRVGQLLGKAPEGRFRANFKVCLQSLVTIRSRFKRLTPAQEREVLLDALAQLVSCS